MERTARLIVYALAFERNIVAYDLDNICRGKDSIDCISVNHSVQK